LANLAGLIATFYITALLFVVVVLGLVARAAGLSLFALLMEKLERACRGGKRRSISTNCARPSTATAS